MQSVACKCNELWSQSVKEVNKRCKMSTYLFQNCFLPPLCCPLWALDLFPGPTLEVPDTPCNFLSASSVSFFFWSSNFACISRFFCSISCSCFDIWANLSFLVVFDAKGSEPLIPRYAIFELHLRCAVHCHATLEIIGPSWHSSCNMKIKISLKYPEICLN